MKTRMSIIVLIFASILVSCGNTSPSGYLAIFTNAAMFIQWTNTNDQISGTFQEAYQDTALNLKSINESITGTLSGSNISLTFSIWGFPVQTYVGTLNGDQLVISFPQQDGTLQTVNFNPGTVDDYNQAVQSLQATITHEQETATTEQANEQATSTVQQIAANNTQATASAINAAQSQLQSSIGSLQQDSDFSSVLTNYNDHINAAKNDLQQEQQETDCGLKQGDEGLVQGDAGLVQADDSLFNNQLNSANSDIQSIQQASRSLNQSMPDISSETSAINQAKAKAAQYDTTIQNIVQQAKAIANC